MPSTAALASDCHGHGTHVGGTVGSTTYGVAKLVTLVAVRVLNCQGSGTNAQVIQGVDWVTGDHARRAAGRGEHEPGRRSKPRSRHRDPEVDQRRHQLRGRRRQLERQRVQLLSRETRANAVTVGATGSTDARASFSNFGSCVDVFAPGVNITSSVNDMRHMRARRMERHVDGDRPRSGCRCAPPQREPGS